MAKKYKILLIIILALGVFSRVYRLGDKILWIDEGYDLRVAKMHSVAEIREFLVVAIITPIPNIIDHFWIKAFGDSVFAIHLESVVWSLLALFLFCYTAFRFFPWRVAFGAVAVFSLGALLPEFAQLFRYNSMAGLVTLIWLLALFEYRENKRLKWLAIYTAAMSLALFIHLYALFTIISISVYTLIFIRTSRLRFWPIAAAHAAALASIIPRFILNSQTGMNGLAPHIPFGQVMEHLSRFPAGGIARVLLAFCAGRTFSLDDFPLPALFAIFAAFGIVAAAALFSKNLKADAWFCVIVLGGSILLGWFAMLFRGLVYAEKYYVPLFCLFALVLSIGAERIRQWKPALPPILLIIYFIFSFSILGVYWSRLDRPENMKTILQHVKRNARPGDFLNVSPPYVFAYAYYWRNTMPTHDFSRDFDPATTIHSNIFLLTRNKRLLTEKRMMTWHKNLASKYKRVWMFWILGTRNTEDDDQAARRWLDSHYQRIETRRYRMFPYSNIYMGEMVLYRIR